MDEPTLDQPAVVVGADLGRDEAIGRVLRHLRTYQAVDAGQASVRATMLAFAVFLTVSLRRERGANRRRRRRRTS